MTDFFPPQMPGPVHDLGGGAALPVAVPAQGVMVQTQMGGAIEIRRAARQLPRDLARVKHQIGQLAEYVDPVGEHGDTWEYRFPVKNRKMNRIDWIEGPTIKCTMAIARCYGNASVMTSRVDDLGGSWMIYATFLDYETGFEITRAFQQRKGQGSIGGGDAGRSEDIAFQIGVSKAMRNVVNNALPDLVAYAIATKDRRWKKAIEEKPDEWRQRIRGRLEEVGYSLAKVEAYVGRGHLKDWPVDEIAKISKILTAHRDGAIADLDQIFAPVGMDIEGDPAKPNGGGQAQAEATQVEPEKEQQDGPAKAQAEPQAQPAETDDDGKSKRHRRDHRSIDEADVPLVLEEIRHARAAGRLDLVSGIEMTSTTRARMTVQEIVDRLKDRAPDLYQQVIRALVPGSNEGPDEGDSDQEPEPEQNQSAHEQPRASGRRRQVFTLVDEYGEELGEYADPEEWLQAFEQRHSAALGFDQSRLVSANEAVIGSIVFESPGLRERCVRLGWRGR